jgi:hypothetical protein
MSFESFLHQNTDPDSKKSVRSPSVADPDRFGPDPDQTSENRPDSDPDLVKTGSGSGLI